MSTEKVQILLVEDDANLGFLLKENYEAKGFGVELCRDGKEAVGIFQKGKYQVYILDVMLPFMDGFSLAKEIRKKDDDTPIIFLTAKSLETDRIKGFTAGCDDYVCKPFSAQELLMRINAILKRTNKSTPQPAGTDKELTCIGNFTIDFMNRTLYINGEKRSLSTKESDLLKILCDHKNTMLNRSAILRAVWGNDDYFAAKSMDVYLSRIRKLLKEDPRIEIQNIHGTGFRLMVNE